MTPIKIRDLHTGEILTRHGAVAEEILASREPQRDEDGNVLFDEDNQPVPGDERRYVRHGREPRDWVHPKGSDKPAAPPAAPVLNRRSPAAKRRAKQQTGQEE